MKKGTANIKIILLVAAFVIVGGTLLYTRHLVYRLTLREREVASLYARSIQFVASSDSNQTDYSFVFDELVRHNDLPLILTDVQDQPVKPYASSVNNLPLDTTLSSDQQLQYIVKEMSEFDGENEPIKVVATNGEVINYVHYGQSDLVTSLSRLPYIEITVAGMFILIGYLGFSYVKKGEHDSIWVGMSRETAHQLGTPLSSLMAWIEMLKYSSGDDPKRMEIVTDMENDLGRLQKVTDRFSKIGSKPSLKDENLGEVIGGAIGYYRKRLPSKFGKEGSANIEIVLESGADIHARINKELFEWVIENLIKNALDAMEGKGRIAFNISREEGSVFIDVKDTGKGIDVRYKKDIFRPGYTTKARGWGLGLSLSKRIIENYHKGKLFIKESRVGKGTTFRIRLLAS